MCFGFNRSSQNQDVNFAPALKERKTRDEVGAEKIAIDKRFERFFTYDRFSLPQRRKTEANHPILCLTGANLPTIRQRVAISANIRLIQISSFQVLRVPESLWEFPEYDHG